MNDITSLKKLTVFLTGATGFVGSHVLLKLIQQGCKVKLITRRKIQINDSNKLKQFIIPDLEKFHEWDLLLDGVDCVVHCAAISHSYRNDPVFEKKIWAVNCHITKKIVKASLQTGVKRFVFLSTVKVYGERSQVGQFFKEDSIVAPTDVYALAKLEAEREIKSLCKGSRMEFVIIRSPVVYGPGVKGNINFILKLIKYRCIFPKRVLNRTL